MDSIQIYVDIKKKSSQKRELAALIEQVEQSQSKKIRLVLLTMFQTDSQFEDFVATLIEIAKSIQSLTWTIRVPDSDSFQSQQTKSIGECLRFCKNMRFLSLHIFSPPFEDKAAIQLARQLRRLNNLRILSIEFLCDFNLGGNRMTMLGVDAINIGISEIPNLELINYAQFLQPHAQTIKSPRFSMAFFSIKPVIQEVSAIDRFISETESIWNRISVLHVNYHENYFEQPNNIKEIYPKIALEQVFMHATRIPYLTDLVVGVYILKHENSDAILIVLGTLLRARRKQLAELFLFEKLVAPELKINPRLVALDLQF